MEDYLGLVLNLANQGLSEYCKFNFNSMCKFGGVYLGATDAGIHTLGGATDNGTDIDAFLKLALSDWDLSNYKKIRKLFFGLEVIGDLLITIEDDDGDLWTYTMEFHRYDRQGANIVKGRRDKVGVFWSIRIDNIDGCFFAIDYIEALPIMLGRSNK